MSERIENKERKTFYCDGCRGFKRDEWYWKRKVDSPFNKPTHGIICRLCQWCGPRFKEWNEAQDDHKLSNLNNIRGPMDWYNW